MSNTKKERGGGEEEEFQQRNIPCHFQQRYNHYTRKGRHEAQQFSSKEKIHNIPTIGDLLLENQSYPTYTLHIYTYEQTQTQ
ncbi:MAG: hypothetical protein ACI8RD_010069 [Bacillariaceae sp.]